MPADKFTKKANTSAKKRQWDHVYESAKAGGDSKATAIKKANAAVRDNPAQSKRKEK